MSNIKTFGLLLILSGLLFGCSDEPKPTGATVAVVTDPLGPRYEASLAEGIDFKKPGYPSFLAEVSGMHGREDWGRWTDGPAAKFRFKQPLPSKFTLLIGAGAIGPNATLPIEVNAGNVKRKFNLQDTPGKDTFVLNFEGVEGTDTIELVPPKPVRPKDINPKSDDPRLLGVAMLYLKIR